jgi:hypothetical protein
VKESFTPETPNAQDHWRYCGKCHGLFFDGYQEKGLCVVGGGHEAIGDTFVLPHDVPETPNAQAAWRYCDRCHGLFWDGEADKGRCPAGGGHAAVGFVFVLPHDTRQPLVFTGRIKSGGLAALGGGVTAILHPDGSIRWQGHAHNSGADGYDFQVGMTVRTPTGQAVALVKSGSVGGTFTAGERDFDWNETIPPNLRLREHFADFALAESTTQTEYTSDIGTTIEDLTEWLLTWAAGSTIGLGGAAVLFVGVELGSLIATGSLVPGARLINGVLWMVGPANTMFALVAEGVASLGSRTREMTQEEYNWANAEVFAGSLPPREKIFISDTIAGERAFCYPRWDGGYLIAMGDIIDDSNTWKNPESRKAYKTTLVHELVHACQLKSASINVALAADALAAQVCSISGNPYKYGLAGFDYTDLLMEAQANVVSDWFAGRQRPETNQTSMPKDTNSPYYPYITNNLHLGRF